MNRHHDELTFECRACGRRPEVRDSRSRARWSQLVAFDSDCIRLCGIIDEETSWAAGPDPGGWSEGAWLASMPRVGQYGVARVRHPFLAVTGKPFWFLFQPPTSLANGWDEAPDELLDSGLVRAVLVDTVHHEDDWALAVVEVQETLPVPRLRGHFPESRDGESLPWFSGDGAGRVTSHRVRDHVLVDANLEGDVGSWWLFAIEDRDDRRRPRYRLQLHGEWGPHESRVQAGNLRLAARESSRLERFLT